MRADRLSNLIDKWREDRAKLVSIRDFFVEANNRTCVDICEFGISIIDRSIADFQRANYPLDRGAPQEQ